MGEVANEAMLQLVTALCTSVPVVKVEVQEDELGFEMAKDEGQDDEPSFEMAREEGQDDEASSEIDSSISYDQVLAEFLQMGYDIEHASRAILDCGRLDVAAIIDHMNSEATTSTSVASGISPPRVFEASTSRAHSRMDDLERNELAHSRMDDLDRNELEDLKGKHGYLKGKPEDLNGKPEDLKGKLPATRDDDEAMDSDRWEYDDDPGTDKESSLLRMGFRQEEVTDALEACGENSDVNHLANYIMSKMGDLPDSDWDDDDPGGADMEDVKSSKKMKKGDFKDWPSEELTDQGLLILKNIQSMGCSFSAKMVFEAIQACGVDAADDEVVDYLLRADERELRSDFGGGQLTLTKQEQLLALGCTSKSACLRAIDNNPDADVPELFDYYQADQLHDKLAEEDAEDGHTVPSKRRRIGSRVSSKFPSQRKGSIAEDDDDDACPKFHRNLKGFGLPGEPVIPRQLSEEISRPPYFYFENVHSTPKDEWKNISRHLYNIEPEFVDSLNFAPCRRPRGYVHNLPVEGRVDILPKPPMTVQELIPGSATFWPAWDKRIKLNTINTRAASEFVRRQISGSLAAVERGQPSQKDIETIMYWAKKWNLVWIGPGELGPLRSDEIETCLGFDVHHTRVLFSSTDQVRVLGNSFQVNTVAFHLSVLRPMYSSGIRVLSLFSGIGGAEVALHKLGIFLKVVVSVEIDDKARMVVESWWKNTNQRGKLIHTFKDVKDLNSKAIQNLIDEFGGFDLVIGGSPCNNLSGNNRCSRVGLAGSESIAFFEFPRILGEVRDYMAKQGR